jgi:hypothetical protein
MTRGKMNTLDIEYQDFRLTSALEILEKISPNLSSGYLMNRETLGIPLRKALTKRLHSLENGTLVIDMAGVKEMTTSVAEEIGPLLFQELIKYRMHHENVWLTYCNVNDEIAKGLDKIFKPTKGNDPTSIKQTMVVFSMFQDAKFSGYHFLGQEIPTALEEILDVIYQFNVVSSSTLEEQGIKAASKKLSDLAKYYPWLFRKIAKSLDVDSRAWAYFYSPIVPVVES